VIAPQVSIALRGDLAKYEQAVSIAHTTGIRSAVNRMKTQGRAQMTRAGLGSRLPKAFRGEVRTPSGQDITRRGLDPDPFGRVFSKASLKGRGNVDLIEVFEREGGVTIQGHPYLAMPTPKAGGRRAKPMRFYPPNTFRIIKVKRSRGRAKANAVAAVAVHKVRNEVWYLLIAAVRLKRRLRLAELFQRIARTVVADIDRRFERAKTRAERD